MAKRVFNVRASETATAIEFSKDFGADLASMTELFGAATVYEMAMDNMVIALQGKIRSMLTGKNRDKRVYSIDEINNMVETWKPTLRNSDPSKKLEAVKNTIKNMPDDVRKALLAELASEQQTIPQVLATPEPAKTTLRKGSRKAA